MSEGTNQWLGTKADIEGQNLMWNLKQYGKKKTQAKLHIGSTDDACPEEISA